MPRITLKNVVARLQHKLHFSTCKRMPLNNSSCTSSFLPSFIIFAWQVTVDCSLVQIQMAHVPNQMKKCYLEFYVVGAGDRNGLPYQTV